MPNIIAVTKNENFMILASVGVEVYICENQEEMEKHFRDALKSQTKIIIYDAEGEDLVSGIIEDYDDNLYPIFLKLPSGGKNEDMLLELKNMIEKSLGISVI